MGSYDNWKQTEPYDPYSDSDPRDEDRFPCPCGDERCWGFTSDPHNVLLGTTWYAADCQMVKHHPLIVEERERASRADIARDDVFNRR